MPCSLSMLCRNQIVNSNFLAGKCNTISQKMLYYLSTALQGGDISLSKATDNCKNFAYQQKILFQKEKNVD